MVGNWLTLKTIGKGKKKMGKKGLGTLIKTTGGNWMIRRMVDGKAVCQSTGTKNKSEAKAIQKRLAKQRDEEGERTIDENIQYHRERLEHFLSLKRKKEIKLEDLFEEFLKEHELTDGTKRVYKTAINVFRTFMTEKFPEVKFAHEVTEEMMEGFIANMKENGKANNTISLKIVILKKILNSLNGQKTITAKTSKSNPEKERRALTTDEIKKVFEAIKDDKDLLVLFGLGLYCGMRRTDAACLKWGNVDMEKKVITFLPQKTQKSGKVVVVPIHSTLMEILMKIERGDKDEYLCPKNAKNAKSRHLTRKIKGVFKGAGIKTDDEKERFVSIP